MGRSLPIIYLHLKPEDVKDAAARVRHQADLAEGECQSSVLWQIITKVLYHRVGLVIIQPPVCSSHFLSFSRVYIDSAGSSIHGQSKMGMNSSLACPFCLARCLRFF